MVLIGVSMPLFALHVYFDVFVLLTAVSFRLQYLIIFLEAC